MSFVNLSLGELMALFGAVSAIVVTLYLLDRSRRKQVVSTLRFWSHSETNTELRQRKRIQQPWSLLLQLVSLALLLLAIAQWQWGSLERNSHDHVLILDTSAWMSARSGKATLMDDARLAALAYLRTVPGTDRVLLLRADGLATPATVMGSNRTALERAVRDSRPSASALNLDQAFEVAKRAQRQGRKAGEIVYVGPGRVASETVDAPPPNLRVLAVKGPAENCGIRRMGLRRSETGDEWELFVSARNYGRSEQVAMLAVQFGGAPLGSRTLTLKPNSEQESTFRLRTKAAGLVEARLLHNDAFPDDNRAVLEVPSQNPLRVVVYSVEPEVLRPVLAANPRVVTQFRNPAAYVETADADVVVFDRFAPARAPKQPSIWIEPPASQAPVKVRNVVSGAKLARWNTDHEMGAGLHTKDVVLESAQLFSPAEGDSVIAECEQGALIVARPQPKSIVLGFNPARSSMKYELATPLLFANALRWVRPELFLRWELNSGTVGTVETELGKHIQPASVRVISENGKPAPYTFANGHLRFFAGLPGNVRIQTGDREIVYSLTLPEAGLAEWKIPDAVRRGLPRVRGVESPVRDLWQWLAALGALGLLAEWLLYGRGRRTVRLAKAAARNPQRIPQRRAS